MVFWLKRINMEISTDTIEMEIELLLIQTDHLEDLINKDMK